MQKVAFLMILLVALTTSAYSQRAYDLESARKLALTTNKLIILDFWANWCGPCRDMDRELWNTPEFAQLMDRFVFVRVDIDANRSLAMQYNIKAIPRVVIITPNDDRLFDRKGFTNARMYLNAFRAFPTDYGNMSQTLMRIIGTDEPAPKEWFAAGSALQAVGYGLDDQQTKIKFLGVSDAYFKRAEKAADTPAMEQKAELAQLLNDAYLGKHKKVLKKLAKGDFSEKEEALANLKHFVTAYCYQCRGQKQKANAAKEKITDEELLAKLEQ